MEQNKKTGAGPTARNAQKPQGNGKQPTSADLEGRERPDQEALSMAKNYINVHHINNDPDNTHIKEQLYLLYLEGFPEDFIDDIFCRDRGIQVVSLDLLRCLAFLGGEAFARKFYKRSFTLTEAKNDLADQAVLEKYRQFDEVSRLTAEIGKMRESFDIQMEFLKREHDNARTYAEELIRQEKEAAASQLEAVTVQFETEKKLLQAQADNQKEGMRRDLSECTKKLETLQSEAGDLRTRLDQELEKNRSLTLKINSMKQQKETTEEGAPVKQGRQWGTWRHSAKKEQTDQGEEIRKTRNQFIFMVLSDPDYKEDQLDVITHAIGAGLDKEALEKLCNPKLPAQNMQIFENFCLSEKLKFPGEGGDAQ